MIEMISRRLTKMQKAEIVEAYRAGKNTSFLAERYKCTPNTIIRTVKTLLSDNEYVLLKKNRSKTSKKNQDLFNNKPLKEQNEDLEQENALISFKPIIKEEDLSIKVKKEFHSPEFDDIASKDLSDARYLESIDKKNKNYDMSENNQKFDNNFEEIAPLLTDFELDLDQKKSDFEILNYKSLPESVYMIVDKKVELELHPISDLPEWSFLPEKELQRNAILLFANQRSAKRICSRNQRVIKIPNTNIFQLSKSFLISKGITRLILEDSIIGLDD